MQKNIQPWATIKSLTQIPLDNIEGVAADIDYTIMDFDIAHQAGMKALAASHGSELAQKVEEYFRLVLEGHRKPLSEKWDKRDSFDKLMARVESSQKLSEGHLPKPWSREVFILLASEELGKVLQPKELAAARDSYWQNLGASMKLYPDAEEFLKLLKEKNIPLILMTGSDSVLSIQEDTALFYDPEFSDKYKRDRVLGLNIDAKELIIGDPIDKPHEAYYDVVEKALKKHGATNPERIIAVGDSPRSDLEVLVSRGYMGYHINRN